MEEDAGKSVHRGTTGRIHGADYSLMDYNRAGVPLIEIVTKVISGTGSQAPAVASAYVATLRDIIRSLGVSDVRMEQGSLRCDANVSLMPRGSQELGTRTETKNLNSLRSIEKALTYEICRQGAILSSGGKVVQETRHFHEETETTSSGRSKEEAEDYRYFPEPDLPAILASPQWVEQLSSTIGEPPAKRRARLQEQWGLTELEFRDVVAGDALNLMEDTISAGASPQAARKWWMGELMRRANTQGVSLDDLAITGAQVAELQSLIDAGVLNDKVARQVIVGVLDGEGSPGQIVEARGLSVVTDSAALHQVVELVIAENPAIVDKIRSGKTQAVGALIGQVMTKMSGQADAGAVRQLLDEFLTK
jgi:aspartyl-tRNA(Asn)/glutamyl-tRNA(Gln) amidotransferase subunit B